MPDRTHSVTPHLLLTDACWDYDGVPVLTDVNLTLNTDSRLGIVGDNGQGKTTLLKLLAGELEPRSGTLTAHGSRGYAEQRIDAALTVGELSNRAIADSVAALQELEEAAGELSDPTDSAMARYEQALATVERLDAWDAERRLSVALARLHATHHPDTSLSALSVGQRHRVWLACLLGGDHDFILLDEPTNHLDESALEFLTEALMHRRGGVAVVSHDRALLSDVTTSIIDVDPTPDGKPRIYGSYSAYVSGSLAMRASWEQDYASQQAQLAELEQDLQAAQDRLISGWRPPKGTGKHQRATRAGATVKAVHRRTQALEDYAVELPPPPLRLNFPELAPEAEETTEHAPYLVADDICLAGRLQRPVSVSLAPGSRLVVTGSNGAGKSTLLSLLAGTVEPTSGEITLPEGHTSPIRIGYLRQESDLPAQRTAIDHYDRSQPLLPLAELGLLPEQAFSQRLGELSIGQQRRLDLAVLLAQLPHVLLLDEPTNHLSVSLVTELTEALLGTRAAVVLVSHDRQLLRDVRQWPRLELS